MCSSHVQVYCGDGRGKTNAAIGQCIKYASLGKSVIIVQFMKGCNKDELECLTRLEPEIRLFRFETNPCNYVELSKEEQMEEDANIRNGLNYVNKVLATGECDLVVVDEILGLLENHIVELKDVRRLIETKDEETELILTGRNMPDDLLDFVSEVYEIKTVKRDEA